MTAVPRDPSWIVTLILVAGIGIGIGLDSPWPIIAAIVVAVGIELATGRWP